LTPELTREPDSTGGENQKKMKNVKVTFFPVNVLFFGVKIIDQ
jgi:hypothetical protein